MKNILYRLFTIAYMAALILTSIQPAATKSGVHMEVQKFNNVLHMPAYGLLTFLLIKCGPKFRYIYIASFLLAVAFGAFNEYLQSFVPSRFASGMDVALNGLGSLIGVFVVAKWRKSQDAKK